MKNLLVIFLLSLFVGMQAQEKTGNIPTGFTAYNFTGFTAADQVNATDDVVLIVNSPQREKTISAFGVDLEKLNTGAAVTVNLTLAGSNFGSVWTDLITAQEVVGADEVSYESADTLSRAYRYYRLTINRQSGDTIQVVGAGFKQYFSDFNK